MKHYNRWSWLQTRVGFVVILVVLYWAKTQLANVVDFKLYSGASPIQMLTMLLNPIPVTLLLLGIGLYFKSSKLFYPITLLLALANTILLQVNVIYYREFSDIMSVNVILGYNKVNQGLGASGLALSDWHDILYWIDIPILLLLWLCRKVKFNRPAPSRFIAFATTTFGVFLGMVTLLFAEMERPQLITRQFDSKVMVKYMGVDAYTVFDAVRVKNVSELKKTAKKSDLEKAQDYLKKNNAPANLEYAGVARGRNVFVIHLESFQQFSIDQTINGQAVTPNINEIYHSPDTIAFDNFFHQVGQGKTSDAENLLETSTFGLPQGSLFATQGSDQTFQAMPSLLKQKGGYSSAVFHGNNASFWNRNNVYKNMGYQYFFDASYFDTSGNKAMGYGLKDKLLFNDSVPYLEQMQQPFYAKYITVTNHFPYTLDDTDKDPTFQTTLSGSKIVDGYFETNRYLDQSIGEFYDYLKKTGLYENSMIVMYGDHYGISNSENKYLAPILGKDPDEWTANDTAEMQRVPFIINIPGYGKGEINHRYGGELDVAPTLLHLLGIENTQELMMVGQDLLSEKHRPVVAFRDGTFMSKSINMIGDTAYDTKTGEAITEPTEKQAAQIERYKQMVREQLAVSDSINQKDLLRFYTPKGFKPVDAKQYNYSNGLERLRELSKLKGQASTDLFTLNGQESTAPLYETDAPEKGVPRSNTSRIQQVNPDSGDTEGQNNKPNP